MKKNSIFIDYESFSEGEGATLFSIFNKLMIFFVEGNGKWKEGIVPNRIFSYLQDMCGGDDTNLGKSYEKQLVVGHPQGRQCGLFTVLFDPVHVSL